MNESSSTISNGSSQAVHIDDGSLVNLIELHELVLRRNGRIELTTRDGGASVLISKSELEALEHALEILSDTNDVRAIRDELSRLAGATMSVESQA
jgi:hypothetical protein